MTSMEIARNGIVDGSIYFYTLYHDGFKFEAATDTYKLSWTVTDGE